MQTERINIGTDKLLFLYFRVAAYKSAKVGTYADSMFTRRVLAVTEVKYRVNPQSIIATIYSHRCGSAVPILIFWVASHHVTTYERSATLQ